MQHREEITEPGYVDRRMKEIYAQRDEIRRRSEKRVKMGLTPFPTVEEHEARKTTTNAFYAWDDDRDARRWG